jgi:hypothetical protein
MNVPIQLSKLADLLFQTVQPRAVAYLQQLTSFQIQKLSLSAYIQLRALTGFGCKRPCCSRLPYIAKNCCSHEELGYKSGALLSSSRSRGLAGHIAPSYIAVLAREDKQIGLPQFTPLTRGLDFGVVFVDPLAGRPDSCL